MNVTCKNIPRKLKKFSLNKKDYKKLSEHIGQIPIVIIAPADNILLDGGSEERRKFIDTSLSQIDGTYLKNLIQYQKILQQRNATLKKLAELRSFNQLLINTYNEQLLEPAQYIFESRKAFIEDFQPFFKEIYEEISGGQEPVDLAYTSPLFENDFAILLAESIEKDRILQRTTVGVHKDDLKLILDKHPAKKFASQGQKKSFVLSLKLAQYHWLRELKGELPILLLDDIFDKLDKKRVQQLIDLLKQPNFGQVFITDTDQNRVEEIMNSLNLEHEIFVIREGQCINHDKKE